MSKRILLAEDSAHDAHLILRVLDEQTIAREVVLTSDGADALDYLYCRGRFQTRHPEDPVVILLDLKMPRVDGFEVLSQIKADERLKMIPVVIFSSSREEIDLVRSYRLGVNAYVVKPVGYDEFRLALREIQVFWVTINEPPPRLSH